MFILVALLSSRVLTVKTADEFYSAMGELSQEMLQFTTPQSNHLIKVLFFNTLEYCQIVLKGAQIRLYCLYQIWQHCSEHLILELHTLSYLFEDVG